MVFPCQNMFFLVTDSEYLGIPTWVMHKYVPINSQAMMKGGFWEDFLWKLNNGRFKERGNHFFQSSSH